MRRIVFWCTTLLAVCAVANALPVKINAGARAPVSDWRCDTGKFATSPSNTYLSPRGFSASEVLANVFRSHRWVLTGDLHYKIPVPDGRYNVTLLFAETYDKSALGFRLFTVKINGEKLRVPGMDGTLDVFEKAGGLDKPLHLDAGTHPSVNGLISVSLGRVPGRNNPMLSGLIISGDSADALLGDEGVTSCVPGPTPLPTVMSVPTFISGTNVSLETCGKKVETNFEGAHFAHAVPDDPDRPYIVTDFKKVGYASVMLDGLNSHSHHSSPNESPRIVKYEWTWRDPSNPKADANGMVKVTSPKSTQDFPLGVTTISLLVIDQFCNAAIANTTVTVQPAIEAGAYCYYYNFGKLARNNVSLPVSLTKGPRPLFGRDVETIDFRNGSLLDDVPFKGNTVAVRCVFKVNVLVPGPMQYQVHHNGLARVFHQGDFIGSSNSQGKLQILTTASRNFSIGLQDFQIHFVPPSRGAGVLALHCAGGSVVPKEALHSDASTILPIIAKLSKASGSAEDVITISGESFVNGVKVTVGGKEAVTLDPDDDSIKARIPPGTGTVPVKITTGAGQSNSLSFTYKAPTSFPVKFEEETLSTPEGKSFGLTKIAVLKYGPDGRLYAGSVNSRIYALRINKKLQVTQKCEKSVFESWERAVLGIDFDPTSNNLKMYFTTSTHEWRKRKVPEHIGWKNGKVKSVTMAGPDGCFNDDVSDVVTGLPVSNHDHGVQAIQFISGGRMLIAIGGVTNGGISHPKDGLGGIPSSPLSGAIVECPATGTNIVYTSSNPLKAKIKSDGCKTYATGLRNTFGMEFHTNGNLYATDNGPNEDFGEFSTDCNGGQKKAKNLPDKLFKVEEGRCHGHPNINRGRDGSPEECAFEDSRCVKPLLRLQSSTNGVVEYRSNIFGNKAKGDLFLSKFTSEGEGRVSRVVLEDDGSVGEHGHTKEFAKKSGLSIVEGPRGELIMSRVFKGDFVVLTPDYAPKPTSTFLISVLPRKGPASGGGRTLVSGYNFGTAPTAAFGGAACTNVTVIDDESFTCIVPPGVAGARVIVEVTGKGGVVGKGVGSDYWYF